MGPRHGTGWLGSVKKPMDSNFNPYFSIGSIFVLPIPVLEAFGRAPSTPNIMGTEGPYMSASIKPVFAPLACNASARLAATVDLPTPPLPDATRIIFLMFGNWLFCIPPTREVILISTAISLSTKSAIALRHACSMCPFSGQAGVVSTTSNRMADGVISTFLIILRVTKSFLRSGSSTWLSACSTCSFVIIAPYHYILYCYKTSESQTQTCHIFVFKHNYPLLGSHLNQFWWQSISLGNF